MCFIGFLVIVKGLHIQFVEGEQLREVAQNTTRIDTIEGERGNIYSEDGRLLATSLPYFELRMDVMAVNDSIFETEVDTLAGSLAQFFKDKPKENYLEKLKTAKTKANRYLLIKRQIDYNELQAVKQFPIFRYGKYKGGFIAKQTNKRINPFQLLAKRTIGYARKNVQSVGLEGSFNRYLRGSEIPRSMHKRSGGAWVPLYDDFELEAKNGRDVYTTLDINLQDIVESALMKAMHQHKPNHGCAILMEVETGKIKAIANLGMSSDSTTYWEKYNYAIGEKTEPGSTFKIAPLTALLDDGFVTPETIVDVEDGRKEFYDKVMQDDSWHPNSLISVTTMMERSSNVGIAKLIDEHYKSYPYEFIRRLEHMQLTEPTGIGIKGEPKPTIKKPNEKDWSGVTMPWMSIGYELQITPLQQLTFINAIANNGKMMKPYLVDEVKDLNTIIKKYKPRVVRKQICKPETAQAVQKIMEGIVLKGTAKNIQSPYVRLAGKTGTAKIAETNQGYQQKVYQASFVGFFPADNPTYSCIVVVSAPSGADYYGGKVAAPIFKEIAERTYASSLEAHPPINPEQEKKSILAAYVPPSPTTMPKAKHGYQEDMQTIFNTLNIQHTKSAGAEWIVPSPTDTSVAMRELKIIPHLVPNVTGMGLRDAMYILENHGLKVKFSGSGKVVDQDPSYGQPFSKSSVVSLTLK